ncbi:ADP-ribosylglycohydrolase family protein [Methanospirillum hungatei]|uniref:ADP-ribosylglycohydrolase family protein n=1 Tax=Methanospirillum hungatei TaxID=2203 RepID=UPI0026F34B0D|nr:ADP-ribosylglycohydrolase family protein [Methanospirillum hungatei]MCA1915178.1 ADP-ribosylglycohydrolase family protein [Methanospirillum hungatei]
MPSTSYNPDTSELTRRIYGSIYGLAIGDALGAPIEFSPPGSFTPVTGFRTGGPFNLPAGTWTDDTSLALCLIESLVECNGCDINDQMQRFVRWYQEGHLSATGHCFDIGTTTRSALHHFFATGDYQSREIDDHSAGNGSLMRIAPVPLFFHKEPHKAIYFAGESSKGTHNHPAAVDACRYFAGLIVGALQGISKEKLLSPLYAPIPDYWDERSLVPEIAEVAMGSFLTKEPPEIAGSGYVVKSLEAALWAFAKGRDYRESVLLAVNLGGDTDTTGAICGQLAGAYYGIDGIPDEWCRNLAKEELISEKVRDLIHAIELV